MNIIKQDPTPRYATILQDILTFSSEVKATVQDHNTNTKNIVWVRDYIEQLLKENANLNTQLKEKLTKELVKENPVKDKNKL